MIHILKLREKNQEYAIMSTSSQWIIRDKINLKRLTILFFPIIFLKKTTNKMVTINSIFVSWFTQYLIHNILHVIFVQTVTYIEK